MAVLQAPKSKASSGVTRSGRLFLLELSGDRIHSMNTDGSDRRTVVSPATSRAATSSFSHARVEHAGLAETVDGHALIYIHQEQALADIERRYPVRHYVLIDDKLRILDAVNKSGRTA